MITAYSITPINQSSQNTVDEFSYDLPVDL